MSIVCISCGRERQYKGAKPWIFLGTTGIWRCIPRNTQVATKKGDRFLNWFSARSFPGVKKTLQKEHTRVKIITDAVGWIVEERVHTSKCFTLGSTSTFFQKEGWNLEAMYWLSTTEKVHYKEKESTTSNWWPLWSAKRRKYIFKDWLEGRIPLGKNQGRRHL